VPPRVANAALHPHQPALHQNVEVMREQVLAQTGLVHQLRIGEVAFQQQPEQGQPVRVCQRLEDINHL